MSKPRLKYIHEYDYWLCFINGKPGIGIAQTPKEAYERWKSLKGKTEDE